MEHGSRLEDGLTVDLRNMNRLAKVCSWNHSTAQNCALFKPLVFLIRCEEICSLRCFEAIQSPQIFVSSDLCVRLGYAVKIMLL